jgi:hypothetical protein
MLACRALHSWSEWHGGEALGVKVLEAANVFALIPVAVTSTIWELTGLARKFSACGWSWVLACSFLIAASVQWFVLGAAIDAGMGYGRLAPSPREAPCAFRCVVAQARKLNSRPF